MSAYVECPKCGHVHLVQGSAGYFKCPKCGWVMKP
jgi:ribosomal protein L37AE/L43A